MNNIEKYLGQYFLYEKVIVFRNYHIPDEFQNYDIYSNIWHQDSHDGNRLLKLFILAHDVTLEDGPLHFLSESSVKINWLQLRERWDFEKMKEIPSFVDENILTGGKGDYLILDTSRCMHRASNPKTSRDIIQIALYPNWRKSKSRRKYHYEH